MKPWRRLFWFGAVGATAAAVHYAVVLLLVERFGLAPLLANVAAWVVAFAVSFAGQSRLTFGDRQAPLRQAAPRFLVVSALGFAVNETAYAWLLHGLHLRYDLALAAVLIGVAVMTYALSSLWAFRRRRPPASAPSP